MDGGERQPAPWLARLAIWLRGVPLRLLVGVLVAKWLLITGGAAVALLALLLFKPELGRVLDRLSQLVEVKIKDLVTIRIDEKKEQELDELMAPPRHLTGEEPGQTDSVDAQ